MGAVSALWTNTPPDARWDGEFGVKMREAIRRLGNRRLGKPYHCRVGADLQQPASKAAEGAQARWKICFNSWPASSVLLVERRLAKRR